MFLKEQKSILKISTFLLQSQSSSATATILDPRGMTSLHEVLSMTDYAPLSVLSENVQWTFAL